ncbi:dihydropteroate synthase [Marininema halotolerans]|uniref:Dihydropteroate synthase n=1 Tax=Marininema halotolerans TaxID=1155944 RepID=A0A1I6TB48_9BACL|nr:dihydropteroate synthase [Marininema halotolerans]SFS86217.1 dihydropteroate synthase [Marininema halotolerans]
MYRSMESQSQFRRAPFQVGPYRLPIHERTVVMGILNLTPDSFSDGGKYNRLDGAVAHAQAMIEAGADIIDVGGESTRPGHQVVPMEEELDRVLPVIERLAQEIDCPISIDTYKAETARQAVKAGAHIINDVWGMKKDPVMASVVAKFNVPVILMHNRVKTGYRQLMNEVCQELLESVALARNAGVADENIILDPGIGFAKSHQENLVVMRHLEQIVALGYPVLLGTSRKSMVGNTLNLPVHQRVEGTGATVALGIAKGCQLIRVHDVKEMVRVARMTDAMVRAVV